MLRLKSIVLILFTFGILSGQTLPFESNKSDAVFFDKTTKILHSVQAKGSSYNSDSSFIYYSASKDNGISWSDQKMIVPVIAGKKLNPKDPSEPLQITCDQSKTKFDGRIYVCWSDEKHGKNDKDVFLVYSDDKGENWTEPILVTYHPNHKEQYNPVLNVNKQNGGVNIFYFDRQNYFDQKLMDLYLAQSKNGGLKFDYYKLNTEGIPLKNSSFVAEEQTSAVKVTWTNGKNSSAPITVSDSSLTRYQKQNLVNELTIDRSFPFSEKIKLAVVSAIPLVLTAIINKPLEPAYEKILFKNRKFQVGSNEFELDTKKENLPKGNYVLTLYFNNKNTYVWITE